MPDFHEDYPHAASRLEKMEDRVTEHHAQITALERVSAITLELLRSLEGKINMGTTAAISTLLVVIGWFIAHWQGWIK